MNINLKQLEAFVWVADLGSFRKAADRLNTTQPNISARISGLETALNVTLMERDAGSVRLNSKGEAILKHARAVLKETDALVIAAGQNALLDGTLRLGVTEMIVHTWLREFLKALKEQYPAIIVELTVDLSANLKEELFSRSIDLAFQNGPFQRQTTGSEDLGTYPWIWVASPELEINSNARISAEELVKHPILTHARDTKPYADVEGYLKASNARLVPSSNLATCLHMTVDGMGIATLPAAMVIKELASGELVQLNHAWTPDPMHFLARYDAERSPAHITLAAKLAATIASQ